MGQYRMYIRLYIYTHCGRNARGRIIDTAFSAMNNSAKFNRAWLPFTWLLYAFCGRYRRSRNIRELCEKSSNAVLVHAFSNARVATGLHIRFFVCFDKLHSPNVFTKHTSHYAREMPLIIFYGRSDNSFPFSRHSRWM